MENKCYMAIDPGNEGFIAIQYGGSFMFYSIVEHDLYEISDFLGNIKNTYKDIICVVEDVHALFSSSAKSTFNFGFNKGYLIGILAANHIPYVLVQPKTWQLEIWTNADKVMNYKIRKDKNGPDKEIVRKEVDTKSTSINAAKRLFPDIDFRRNERCKKIDDNKVDATLMSEYARRKNL